MIFRYLEAGLNAGVGAFGVVAPAAFLVAMFPSFADSPLLEQALVLHLGRQLAMMFGLTGLLLFFTLRAPTAHAVRVTMACFVPIDLVAIALFVHGASFLGWDGGTVFNVAFGLFLMLARLPYIVRPERALL